MTLKKKLKLFEQNGVKLVLDSIHLTSEGIKFRLKASYTSPVEIMKARKNSIKRNTKETSVSVSV